jgi:hypothetical protein
MKCPDCSSELDENNVCGNCGMKVERHEQEIEIEYKEFPKSEFLEIRKKPKSESESAEMPVEKDGKKKKTKSNTARLEAASGRQSSSIKQETRATGQDINKRPLLIFLAGLLAAAILAGAYYLLKLLF